MQMVDAPPAMYRFELFTAGGTPNSAEALRNITSICLEYLPGNYKIEVVDVFACPARALSESVFMTPTLLRRAPAPVARIVGTMGNATLVVAALGLSKAGS